MEFLFPDPHHFLKLFLVASREIPERNNAYNPAILDNRHMSYIMLLHEVDNIEVRSIRRDRQEVPCHDVLHNESIKIRFLAPVDIVEQVPFGKDTSHNAVLFNKYGTRFLFLHQNDRFRYDALDVDEHDISTHIIGYALHMAFYHISYLFRGQVFSAGFHTPSGFSLLTVGKSLRLSETCLVIVVSSRYTGKCSSFADRNTADVSYSLNVSS